VCSSRRRYRLTLSWRSLAMRARVKVKEREGRGRGPVHDYLITMSWKIFSLLAFSLCRVARVRLCFVSDVAIHGQIRSGGLNEEKGCKQVGSAREAMQRREGLADNMSRALTELQGSNQ
jgi:hypothetical protein